MVMAVLSDGNSRHSQTKSNRSAAVSRGFEGACRQSTFSWCRNIVISASSCAYICKGAASTWMNSLRKSSIALYPSRSRGHARARMPRSSLMATQSASCVSNLAEPRASRPAFLSLLGPRHSVALMGCRIDKNAPRVVRSQRRGRRAAAARQDVISRAGCPACI